MKSIAVIAFSFVASTTVFAGPIESDLTKLKTQREVAIAKYTAELDKQYVKELNKLQDKALNAKDLDGAIAVKNELSNFGAASPAGSAPTSFASKDEIKKFLTTHRFGYGQTNEIIGTVTFDESGKAKSPRNYMTAWKVTGNRELTVTGWDGRLLLVYRMDVDWQKGALDMRKTTKRDETVGFIKVDGLNDQTTVESPTSGNNSDPNNTVFGRRQ